MNARARVYAPDDTPRVYQPGDVIDAEIGRRIVRLLVTARIADIEGTGRPGCDGIDEAGTPRWAYDDQIMRVLDSPGPALTDQPADPCDYCGQAPCRCPERPDPA